MNSADTFILPATQDIVKLFSKHIKESIIPWKDKEYVGLSVLKEYPDDISFIPVRNKNNVKDSVVLIKIGYSIQKITGVKDRKVLLSVEIHKGSKYIFDHHFYNFNDSNSPTKLSLEESKQSPQPIDLIEPTRYCFYIDRKKFFDTKINRFIRPDRIVNNIYRDHLNTLIDRLFRAKMKVKEIAITAIKPTADFLVKTNLILFGKKINKKRDDLASGLVSPYKHSDLIDSDTEKMRVLNSDFPISYQTARTFFSLVTFIYIIYFYFHIDLLGLVNLLNSSSQNSSIFTISLTAFILLLFDRVIPHLILSLVNFLLIKVRWFLLNLQVELS